MTGKAFIHLSKEVSERYSSVWTRSPLLSDAFSLFTLLRMRITFDNLEHKDISYNFSFVIVVIVIIVVVVIVIVVTIVLFFLHLFFFRCSSHARGERDSEKFFSSTRDSSTAI